MPDLDLPIPTREPTRLSDRALLEPRTREKLEALETLAEQAGLSITLLETVRQTSRQVYLYAKGRELPGKIVTRAKPGETWHDPEVRRAFDVVIVDSRGRAQWNAPKEKWMLLGKLGKSVGLSWGGDFGPFGTKKFDGGHFQNDYLSLADAKQLHRAGENYAMFGLLRRELQQALKTVDALLAGDKT